MSLMNLPNIDPDQRDSPARPEQDSQPIYLDYAATTPVDPEVAEMMLPFLTDSRLLGNPSSIHGYGRAARAAVDTARDRVAQRIGADYSAIYFVSGGTEADNLALIGAMRAAPAGKTHLVTTAIEHPAVLHTARFLQTQGYAVTFVEVDSSGRVDPEAISDAITDRTALVSVMHANNEIGTLQPVEAIAAIARRKGALFHTDAVQTAGLLDVSVERIGCDLLSLCAHKMYGPRGAGALYIRPGTKVTPLLLGGAQEREKRAGTENVPAIAGFGHAALLSGQRCAGDAVQMAVLRDGFLARLQELTPGLRLNGDTLLRLPNIVNVSVEGVDGATLLMSLDRHGVAASSGSACSSGSIEPSHVLTAIGLPGSLAAGSIRFSLGRRTTAEELCRAADIFAAIVHKLRSRGTR